MLGLCPVAHRCFAPVAHLPVGHVKALAITGFGFLLVFCGTVEPLKVIILARAEGTACTMNYDPVCGRKDGKWKTYSNECMAKAAGASGVRKGACSRE